MFFCPEFRSAAGQITEEKQRLMFHDFISSHVEHLRQISFCFVQRVLKKIFI